MNKLIGIFLFVLALAIVIAFPSNGPLAVLLSSLAALGVLWAIHKAGEEPAIKSFLTHIFIFALILRVLVAVFTFVFQLQDFFQPDAKAYDLAGVYLSEVWSSYFFGGAVPNVEFATHDMIARNAGICYIIGAIYFVAGRNMLAVQMVCSVLGAAAAPLIFFCTRSVFKNLATARLAGILAVLFPSLVLWSAQPTKDGFMIFFLAFVMAMGLKLQEKFSVTILVSLFLGIVGAYVIRPYVFFIVASAIVAGFVIGTKTSLRSLVRRLAVITFFALFLSFSGIIGSMNEYVGRVASFEELGRQRTYLATEGDSGYGRDWDVSTPLGALAVLPVGIAYLFLAPFPWQIQNLRQALTLPEMIVWWSVVPFALIGLWFTIKHRFRDAISILVFLFLLSVFYSVFQGNVGTAYRQRVQLQVFILIFVAVGWQFLKERRENTQIIRKSKQRRLIHPQPQINRRQSTF